MTAAHVAMKRRSFLAAFAPALALFCLSGLRAEILQGRNATMHGQRDRAVWQAVNRLAGARLAKPGEQIQAVFFIDLNCPACARFWRWFDTPAHRQWATLWVPVAYMNAQSLGRAVSFLRAADPYRALALNYENFSDEARQGKLPEAPDPSIQEQSRVRANTRYWNGALFPLTPLSIYRNADATYWQLLGLLPEEEMDQYFARLGPARLRAYSDRRP